LTLDADGIITTETLLPVRSSNSPIAEEGSSWLVVADDGSVVRVHPPRRPTRLGSFEGTVDGGAVLADDRTLLAVMHDRLLALDLKTGLVSVRASVSSTSSINGPVTVGADRTVYFTTADGLLVAVDHAGQEVFRATVERVVAPTLPGQYGYGQPYYPGGYPQYGQYGQYGGYGYGGRPDPPIVADGGGRFAFLRSGGRLGIAEMIRVAASDTDGSPKTNPSTLLGGPSPTPHAATPSDRKDPSAALYRTRVSVVTEHTCATPIAVVPTGSKRIAVVCREGIVASYGE
jgi:hypothetical protein